MSRDLLQVMAITLWITAIMGIALWPLWVTAYRDRQRRRMLIKWDMELKAEWAAWEASLTPEERQRMERLGERLIDVVNASTISLKDIEL